MSPNPRRAAVYRFFSADNDLLYVGCSYNPFNRWGLHLNRAPWIVEVARMEPEWFDRHSDATQAEARAIATENPRYNIRPMASALEGRVVVGDGPELLKGWMLDHGNPSWRILEDIGLGQIKVSTLRSGRQPPTEDAARCIEKATRGTVPATAWTVADGANPRRIALTDPHRSAVMKAAQRARYKYAAE